MYGQIFSGAPEIFSDLQMEFLRSVFRHFNDTVPGLLIGNKYPACKYAQPYVCKYLYQILLTGFMNVISNIIVSIYYVIM
jgi:hypothetical protein